MMMGLNIIVSHHLEPEYAELQMPKVSKNRSKRIWKKLIYRRKMSAVYRRLTALVMGNKMIVSPEQYEVIKRRMG